MSRWAGGEGMDIDVIKGYVEVNNDVENETIRYLWEKDKEWTKSRKCVALNLKEINVSSNKMTLFSESE